MGLLEKVEALIARSASSFEEEARTSAFFACKLIRENNLTLREPMALPPPRATAQQLPDGCRKITTKFDGRCLVCTAQHYSGERVYWFQGVGCVCSIDCAWGFVDGEVRD